MIEPSDVRVTVDATTDDTEPVPDGSASAIGGRDTITVGSAVPDGAVDATTAGATTPAGEVNALTNNITAGTAMPVGAVSAVTGITPDTPGDDTSEEADDIPSEDSGQFRAALDAAALRTAALYAISRRVHPSRPGWRERENPSGPTEKSHGPALDLAEVVEALRGGADGIPAMNDEQIAIVIVDYMPLADAQLAQLATSFHSLGRLADRMREDTQDDYSPRAPTSLPVVGPTLLGALLELRDYRGGMTVPTVCHLLQAHTHFWHTPTGTCRPAHRHRQPHRPQLWPQLTARPGQPPEGRRIRCPGCKNWRISAKQRKQRSGGYASSWLPSNPLCRRRSRC